MSRPFSKTTHPLPCEHFIELKPTPGCFERLTHSLPFIAVLTYLAVSAIKKGISTSMAFYLVSIINAASILGRVAAGILGDRHGPLNMLIPFTLLAAIVTYGKSLQFTVHLVLISSLAWPYTHNLLGFIFITIFYGSVTSKRILLLK
jgi:MFS transporter, MCT family, solute carrier family 16 (monocarboxylic acid transporters), member 10